MHWIFRGFGYFSLNDSAIIGAKYVRIPSAPALLKANKDSVAADF
jgi:hypothetical protein